MISTPNGEYENDGRPVVKERLTSDAAYDILVAFSDGRATWEDEPPAPEPKHNPQAEV